MPKKAKTNNKTLAQVKTLAEIKEDLSQCKTRIDPDTVLKEADKELTDKKAGQVAITPESNVFKAMTLLEFDNGMLMAIAIPEQYKTFGIDMMRQLQKEFNCQTVSEKATAELASVNYIRTLEIQNRINSYLALPTISDMGVRFLAVMSKELDRANRQYLAAIQTLRVMKQPPMKLNITTDTAIIGQNQLVQANSHE